MDLIKIGRFIAVCRKKKKITQEQLAERLYITDKAVSKWERGLSLPDADKMLDLCNILDINVNELLNGEKIDMQNYEKKMEELLVELAKQEELKNKRLITDMWVLTITTFIFYIALILISCSLLEEGPILGTIICVSTIVFIIICFYGFKLEVDAGYYECKHCHHIFEEKNYLKLLLAPHFGTSRYQKCPKCGKRTMAKKVLKKEENK
jgi:transcriptional regulator with XRE-family HTH domain